jgi:hypothetical protein
VRARARTVVTGEDRARERGRAGGLLCDAAAAAATSAVGGRRAGVQTISKWLVNWQLLLLTSLPPWCELRGGEE